MTTRPDLHVAVAGQKSKASDYNENFEMMLDYCDGAVNDCETKKQELIEVAQDYMPALVAGQKGYLYSNGTSNQYCGTLFSINNGEDNLLNAPGSGTVMEIEYEDLIPSNAGAPFSTSRWTGDVGSVYTSTYTLSTPYETAEGYPATATLHASSSGAKQAMANMVVYYTDGTSDTVYGTTYYNGTYTREFNPNGRTISAVSVYGGYGISGEGGAWVGGIQISAPKNVTKSVSTADTLFFNIDNNENYRPLTYTNALGEVRTVKALNSIDVSTLADGTYQIELPEVDFKPTLFNGEILQSSELPKMYAWTVGVHIYYTLVIEPTTSDIAYSDNKMTTSYAITATTSTTITVEGYTLTHDSTKDKIRLKSGDIWFSTQEPKEVKICDGTEWVDYKKTLAGSITVKSGIIELVKQPLYNVNITANPVATSFINGASGYVLYPDGYCVQWGTGTGSITLLKPYKDTNYSVTSYAVVSSKTTSGFTLGSSADWQAIGYIN